MRHYRWVGASVVLMLAIAGCAQQGDSKKDNPALPALPLEYVKVEAFGTLECDTLAIGGETTGYTVTAAGQTWELDLRKIDTFVQLAKELDGQKVWVRGAAEVRRWVERTCVPTIVVDDLRDASYLQKKKS